MSSIAVSSVREKALHAAGCFHSLSGPSPDESVLIYLSVSGSVTPMRVLESDSIQSVKLRIQTCKGFVVKNQKLVCGGRELARGNDLVRDYGVADGSVLHLVLRLSDLLAINVKTNTGEEFNFHFERSRDVAYLKKQIAKEGKGSVDPEDQEVLCNGEKLEDQRLIDDISKHRNATIHLLVRKSVKVQAKPIGKNFELSIVAPHSQLNNKKNYDETVDRDTGSEASAKECVGFPTNPLDRGFLLRPVIVNLKVKLSSEIRNLIYSTFDGLDEGNYPIRSTEGTGGAYFMPDKSGNKYISVFKPMDEEPMAVNNPRGLPLSEYGEGLKKGTRVGEGAIREVAAYILDHPMCGSRALPRAEKGFSGVPPTTLVWCMHKGFNNTSKLSAKIGSLQMFMENNGSCEDLGPAAFPVNEVHKITVLDIRMANADRHAGNILLSKAGADGQITLIPIDHGYCLPESFEDCTFEWLYWPQAHQPYSLETVNYIKSLDAEEDIALLKFHGWDISLKCERVLRVSTMLLKKGVERGLTPHAIGSIMCRETLTKESRIEEIIQEAEDMVFSGTSEDLFLKSVSSVMDRHLDENEKGI